MGPDLSQELVLINGLSFIAHLPESTGVIQTDLGSVELGLSSWDLRSDAIDQKLWVFILGVGEDFPSMFTKFLRELFPARVFEGGSDYALQLESIIFQETKTALFGGLGQACERAFLR